MSDCSLFKFIVESVTVSELSLFNILFVSVFSDELGINSDESFSLSLFIKEESGTLLSEFSSKLFCVLSIIVVSMSSLSLSLLEFNIISELASFSSLFIFVFESVTKSVLFIDESEFFSLSGDLKESVIVCVDCISPIFSTWLESNLLLLISLLESAINVEPKFESCLS